MKPGDYRCKNCRRGQPDHTDTGKCLYGPTHFETWTCDSSRHDPYTPRYESGGEHIFRMGSRILRAGDGRCYHFLCLPQDIPWTELEELHQ